MTSIRSFLLLSEFIVAISVSTHAHWWSNRPFFSNCCVISPDSLTNKKTLRRNQSVNHTNSYKRDTIVLSGNSSVAGRSFTKKSNRPTTDNLNSNRHSTSVNALSNSTKDKINSMSNFQQSEEGSYQCCLSDVNSGPDETELKRMLEVGYEAVFRSFYIASDIQRTLTDKQTMTKSDLSPVTIVDFAVQAIVMSVIFSRSKRRFLLAEEDIDSVPPHLVESVMQLVNKSGIVATYDEIARVYKDSCRCVSEALTRGKRILNDNKMPNDKIYNEGYWVLDPIDGTKGFISGGQYAIALCYVYKDEVLLTIIGCPNLPDSLLEPNGSKGSIFFAIKGKGARMTTGLFDQKFHNETATEAVKRLIDSSVPIRSKSNSLTNIRVLHSLSPVPHTVDFLGELLGWTHSFQSVQYLDSMVKYALISRGEGDIMIRVMPEHEKVWDHLPGYFLLAESGGRTGYLDGTYLDPLCNTELSNPTGVVLACSSDSLFGTVSSFLLERLKNSAVE